MQIIQEYNDKVLLNLIIVTNKLYQERSDLISKLTNKEQIQKICKTQIDRELNLYIYNNYSDVKLIYSFMGIRFDYIYPKTPKKLYIGSNPETHFRLYQAIKYQYIANYEEINKTPGLISIIAYKLLRNINNSITYNINNQIIYNPITSEIIKYIITEIKKEVANENYDIIDINGYKHTLKIDYKYEKMRRFTKDEFIEIIKQTEDKLQKDKPTPQEISAFINSSEYFKGSHTTDTLVRKYITLFELRDIVTLKKRRTKAELSLNK